MDHNRRSDDARFLEIETQLQSLEEKVDILNASVADLVAAWKAASWLVNAVKWVGTIAAAITSIYVLVKGIK